jgi:hypothetical protein
MPSLFKEIRPAYGPFHRINILSPASPVEAGEILRPCRSATYEIEVRAWSRQGMGHLVLRTQAFGDLFRIDEDGSEEMVQQYAAVEDDLGRPASTSSRNGTACILWTFSGLGCIRDPGTYFFRMFIQDDAGQVVGVIETREIVVEADHRVKGDTTP